MPCCFGSGLELWSDSALIAICHDSNVFLVRELPLSTTCPSSKLIT